MEINGDTRTGRSEHKSKVRPKDQLQSITAQSSTNLISIANTVYLPYNFCTSRRKPAKSIIRDRGVLAFAIQTNKKLVHGRAHFFTLGDLGTCLDTYVVDEAGSCATSADSPAGLSWRERTDFCLG